MSVENPKPLLPIDFDPVADASDNLVRFAMTEAQREIWVSAQMGADASAAYNVCHAFRVRGAFSIDGMKAALQQLVDRHQALRLVCDPDGETQHVLASVTVPLTVHDVSSLTGERRERQAAKYIERETDLPFDLRRAPCAAL